jgi:hypothetical protein
MNEAFWQNYDQVIAYLFEKGITAHIFFKVYTKTVNWPANGSPTEDLYFKFIVARSLHLLCARSSLASPRVKAVAKVLATALRG